MTDLERDFLRFVCQTSGEPMGVVVDRAQGSTVRSADGKSYLDLLSGMGVMSFGHGNPEVLAAIRAQAERHLHVMVYGEFVQETQVALARLLAALAPAPLSVAYFANSGTEAVEGALKTARKATGRRRLVAFHGSYHGDTAGSLSVCGNPVYRDPFLPLPADVDFLRFDDAADLARIDGTVAAVIVEPVQGEGGVCVPSDGFLPALRARCDTTGALLIFDEVLTGLARTGRWFALEHWNVVPDLLVLAKAVGGGLPLGAFLGSPALMSTLSHDPPLAHVTTFGGHPLSCAAGLAAISFAQRERLPERAAELGRQWLDRLRRSLGPALRGVRGKGLLIGLDFASAETTRSFCRAAFDRGLILGWTLHRDTVVRLAPPLVITEEESERALRTIEELIGELSHRA